MRTKTALLTAALVAAGVASSMAQSNVYSVNIVGYVNLTVKPGFNLISLPLQNADATSSINSVLTNTSPVVPAGAFVSTWNAAGATFNQAVYAGGDGNWYDATGTVLVTNPLPPGQGFFLNLPSVANGGVSNLTITLVGSVLTGTNTYPVNKGLGFYGNFLPISGDITTNGFPVVDNSYLNQWNQAGQSYNQAVVGLGTDDSATNLSGNPGPNPIFVNQQGTAIVTVTPAVGEAFLYFSGTNSTVSWTQTFKVGP
jgi:uncharacterized membrane protein YvlD (DUF360 family)